MCVYLRQQMYENSILPILSYSPSEMKQLGDCFQKFWVGVKNLGGDFKSSE